MERKANLYAHVNGFYSYETPSTSTAYTESTPIISNNAVQNLSKESDPYMVNLNLHQEAPVYLQNKIASGKRTLNSNVETTKNSQSNEMYYNDIHGFHLSTSTTPLGVTSSTSNAAVQQNLMENAPSIQGLNGCSENVLDLRTNFTNEKNVVKVKCEISGNSESNEPEYGDVPSALLPGTSRCSEIAPFMSNEAAQPGFSGTMPFTTGLNKYVKNPGDRHINVLNGMSRNSYQRISKSYRSPTDLFYDSDFDSDELEDDGEDLSKLFESTSTTSPVLRRAITNDAGRFLLRKTVPHATNHFGNLENKHQIDSQNASSNGKFSLKSKLHDPVSFQPNKIFCANPFPSASSIFPSLTTCFASDETNQTFPVETAPTVGDLNKDYMYLAESRNIPGNMQNLLMPIKDVIQSSRPNEHNPVIFPSSTAMSAAFTSVPSREANQKNHIFKTEKEKLLENVKEFDYSMDFQNNSKNRNLQSNKIDWHKTYEFRPSNTSTAVPGLIPNIRHETAQTTTMKQTPLATNVGRGVEDKYVTNLKFGAVDYFLNWVREASGNPETNEMQHQNPYEFPPGNSIVFPQIMVMDTIVKSPLKKVIVMKNRNEYPNNNNQEDLHNNMAKKKYFIKSNQRFDMHREPKDVHRLRAKYRTHTLAKRMRTLLEKRATKRKLRKDHENELIDLVKDDKNDTDLFPNNSMNGRVLCTICFKDVNFGLTVTLQDCQHRFCKNCLVGVINSSKTTLIQCPFQTTTYSCSSYLQEREIKALITEEEFEEYKKKPEAIPPTQDIFYCPTPACFGWCFLVSSLKTFSCHMCKHTSCVKCSAIHEGKTCHQFQKATIEREYQKKLEEAYQGKESYQHLLALDNVDIVANAEKFKCPICFEEVDVEEGVTLRDCLHNFCKECLAGAVQFCETATVKCPFQNDDYACESHLQEREVRALVSREVYDKYLQRSLSLAESQAENSFHCKTPDCRGWCIFEDGVNVFRCPTCKHTNCLTCAAIHEGMNCRQYQDDLAFRCDTNEGARRTRDYLQTMLDNGDAMRCPQCKVILMKMEGCDWLKCSMCLTEVCWITKGPRWGPLGNGDTSGGCKCKVNGKRCHPNCKNCH